MSRALTRKSSVLVLGRCLDSFVSTAIPAGDTSYYTKCLCQHGVTCLQIAGEGCGLQMWRVDAKSRTSYSLGDGCEINSSLQENPAYTEMLHIAGGLLL